MKTPGAALSAGTKAGEWLLVAPAAGRYAVEISGPVPLSGGGVSRLALAPAAAPVSLTEVELPADLAWSAPGTVVVEDRVEGDRRTVRLTSRRGQAQTLEVRRKVDGDAEKLLAQSLVLTLVQLRPDGPRRHDVVIYEVSRGGLGSFTVDLPPGLAVETVGTDEGEVMPAIDVPPPDGAAPPAAARARLPGAHLDAGRRRRAAPRSGNPRRRRCGRATWPWPPR